MPNGELLPSQYTETGYVSNQFTVGPALLWAPFLVAVHGFVLLSGTRGAQIPADGFSFPYLLAIALGTSFYGFLSLLLSYSLARKPVATHWAFRTPPCRGPCWHGMASFGKRFFISLTPVFVFRLALFLQRFAELFRSVRWAFVSTAAPLLLFVLWNGGLIFQWGAHLIPARGPISFLEVAHNQVFVVPRQLSADVRQYLFKRKAFMQPIEHRDIQELERRPPPP